MYVDRWLVLRKQGSSHVAGTWSMSRRDHDLMDVEKNVPGVLGGLDLRFIDLVLSILPG